MTKTCSICRLDKNKENDFSINRANPDGKDYFCKSCKSDLGKTRRRKKKIYFNPTFGFSATDDYVIKNCEVCDDIYYPVRPSHKRCPICSTLVRDTQSHLSAGRSGGHSIIKCSVKEAVAIAKLLRLSSKCCYCHRNYNKENPISIDHIVPIVKGGTHNIENINACCLQCNFSKRDLMLNDWISLCKSVAQNYEISGT